MNAAKIIATAVIVGTLSSANRTEEVGNEREGNCRCFGRHSMLCLGKVSGRESCTETRHLLLLSGTMDSFPHNFKQLLPNLLRLDIEGFDDACRKAATLPDLLVICHPLPILSPIPISYAGEGVKSEKMMIGGKAIFPADKEKIANLIPLTSQLTKDGCMLNDGVNELRAMVGLTVLSLLSQISLLCGGAQISRLLKPALTTFSSSS